MNDTMERIDRHQNRSKTLSIKHKDQVGLLPARAILEGSGDGARSIRCNLQLRQIKVVASDDHLAVDAAIRSVFGLLATMDYVLLDADSRFLAQCQPVYSRVSVAPVVGTSANSVGCAVPCWLLLLLQTGDRQRKDERGRVHDGF